MKKYEGIKGLKLNIGCGNTIQEGFINIDKWERDNPLDLKIDVTKKGLPFDECSCIFIRAEQFLEHLDWLDGRSFLTECYRVLQKNGTLRLSIPDYQKLFTKYVEFDHEFFQVYKDSLNEEDFKYYSKLALFRKYMKRKRKMEGIKTPSWHFSKKKKHVKHVNIRAKRYEHDIEILNWFTHQYGEHLTLHDFKSLKALLKSVGFIQIYKTPASSLESDETTRIESSLHVEALK